MQQHIIKTQIMELHVPSEKSAVELQDRVSAICSDRLVPVLERLCSEFSDPGQIHRIDRMELDIGTLPCDFDGDIFAAKVEKKFCEKFPVNAFMYDNYAASGHKSEIRTCRAGMHSHAGAREREEKPNRTGSKLRPDAAYHEKADGRNKERAAAAKDLELILFFLKTGILPWWAKKDGKNIPQKALERVMADASDDVAKVFGDILSDELCLKRAIIQLSDDALEKIADLLMPRAGREAVHLMEDMRAILPQVSKADIRQQVFLKVFSVITAMSKLGVRGEILTEDFVLNIARRIRMPVEEFLKKGITRMRKLQSSGFAFKSGLPVVAETVWNKALELRQRVESGIDAEMLEVLLKSEDVAWLSEKDMENVLKGDAGKGELVGIFAKACSDDLFLKRAASWFSRNGSERDGLQRIAEMLMPREGENMAALVGDMRRVLPAVSAREMWRAFFSCIAAVPKSAGKTFTEETAGDFLLNIARQKGMAQEDFLRQSIAKVKSLQASGIVFKSGLLLVMEKLQKKMSDERPGHEKHPDLPEIPNAGMDVFSDADEICVDNSGIVLLWPFLSGFFTKLELVGKEGFVSDEARHRSVFILQYLTTGVEEFPEYSLPLNKVLCGIGLSDPMLEKGIDISDDEKRESESLLENTIIHWSQLKKLPVNTFRTMFLQREGSISVRDNSWLLRVKRETHDVLMDKLPWTMAVVMLPWMSFPLYTEWGGRC